MVIRKRRICGKMVKVGIYDGMMRFRVNGSFSSFPDKDKSAGDNYRIIRHDDGSVEIERLTLVPWDLGDHKLEERMDVELNRMEEVFGIEDGCLSSSSFLAGSVSDSLDFLLTEEEHGLIVKSKKGKNTA